jgi:hypothetical protein
MGGSRPGGGWLARTLLASMLLADQGTAAAQRGETPEASLRSAVHATLAGPSPGVQLVLLLHARLTADSAQRNATVRDFDHLVATFGKRAGDSTIVDNHRLYRHLVPFFERHGFDCNERVVLHLEAARRVGLPLPVYARSLDHAGLLLEDQGAVLDPYDGEMRTLLDFARSRGYHGDATSEGYFVSTPTAHYLVAVGPDGPFLRRLAASEHPASVTAQEPLASLLLDAAATARTPKTARALAELALELDPASADAHDTLGNLTADPVLAETEYSLALALDPHLARTHYNLAVVLQMRGQAAAAAREYRAALALQPELLVAAENLGALLLTQPELRDEGIALLVSSLARESSLELRSHMCELLAGAAAPSVSRVASRARPRPGMSP